MTDKMTYKILAIFSFSLAVLAAWSDTQVSIIAMLIAIYLTLWAILAQLEETDD